MEELLAAGANVDVRDLKEWSMLDTAATEGREDVMKVLLRHGGDTNSCDSNGFTALHVAAGVDGSVRDNGGVVRFLLEAGADIEARTTDTYTPLHITADCLKPSTSSGVMCALLEGGADTSASSRFEWTSLHLACRRSNVAGVELLLRWGADEKTRGDDGCVAEHLMGV
ncbi:unnamed protein product [Pylaiella littoralis]